VARTCIPTSCALADLLLKSAKNGGQSSSIIILSRALQSRQRRSIMRKFVAKWILVGTRMERFGEKRRNMACESWWFLTNVQILRAFFISLLIYNCLPNLPTIGQGNVPHIPKHTCEDLIASSYNPHLPLRLHCQYKFGQHCGILL
jgi:hypothetical protein